MIHGLYHHSFPSGPVPGLGVGPLRHWGASDPLLQPMKQVVVGMCLHTNVTGLLDSKSKVDYCMQRQLTS